MPEPFDQRVVSDRAVGNPEDGVDNSAIVGVQLAAALPEHALDDIQLGPFVAVHEALVGDDPVEERGSFPMNAAVIPVVGPGER